MARIRSIKPEFWEDEKVGDLSAMARLLFVGTWNLADDEGLLRWTEDYITASLFMYDGLTVKRTRALMDEVVDANLVFPYLANRQRLGYVVRFREHQRINRPQPGKMPAPSLTAPTVREMYGRRDEWTCHLCGGPINEQMVVPVLNVYDQVLPRDVSTDLNLSLDHVVPQSQNGDDYPSNIKASHIACNKARCDRPITSFRMPASVSRALGRSVNDSVSRTLDDAVNDQGTFTPSRAPADQGAGSREQGAGNPSGGSAEAGPSSEPTSIGVPAVVAAYVDGAREANLPRPDKTLTGRVGKQAKAMIATNDHDTLVTAARACGANGWSDLATQVQRDAVARKQATRGPMDYVETVPRQW